MNILDKILQKLYTALDVDSAPNIRIREIPHKLITNTARAMHGAISENVNRYLLNTSLKTENKEFLL